MNEVRCRRRLARSADRLAALLPRCGDHIESMASPICRANAPSTKGPARQYPFEQRLGVGSAARPHAPALVTESAAGLLTALGTAPYSVTKHGAVAFAEWLSATYRHRGIVV